MCPSDGKRWSRTCRACSDIKPERSWPIVGIAAMCEPIWIRCNVYTKWSTYTILQNVLSIFVSNQYFKAILTVPGPVILAQRSNVRSHSISISQHVQADLVSVGATCPPNEVYMYFYSAKFLLFRSVEPWQKALLVWLRARQTDCESLCTQRFNARLNGKITQST